MRWILRAFLVLLLIPFFLPSPTEPGIRNLPLLIAIVAFFMICLVCRRVRLCRLFARVSRALSEKGFEIESKRLYLYAGFLVLKRGDEIISVCLLLRKRRFYRYHFRDLSQIECWISGLFTAISNRRLGAVAPGGVVYHAKPACQRLAWPCRQESEKHIVFDRLPNRITDSSPTSGELCVGDKILGEIKIHAGNITL